MLPQSSADDGADCHGQTSFLVGHWSSAEGRWIEASRGAELGGVAGRRYSDYGVEIVGAFLLLVSQKL
jgi:hypothetical protein